METWNNCKRFLCLHSKFCNMPSSLVWVQANNGRAVPETLRYAKRIIGNSVGASAPRLTAADSRLNDRLLADGARIAPLAEKATPAIAESTVELSACSTSSSATAPETAAVALPIASHVASIEPHDIVRTFIVNDRTLKLHELWIDDEDANSARAVRVALTKERPHFYM